MTDEQKPTSTALQLLAQIQSVKDGWTLAERDEARAVALAWRPDDGDEYAHMKRLFFVDGWLYHCGRVALARQPAAIDKQDERGAFDIWARERFPAKHLSTNSDSRAMDEAREFAWEGWQARAAATSANVAQGEKRDAKSDRYFLVVENGSYLIVDRERSEMRGDEPDYFVLAWTPNKDDAKFVCDVMNESREF